MEKILKAIEELISDPLLKADADVTDVGKLLKTGALHAALARHHIVVIPELMEERSEKNTDGRCSSIIRTLKVRYHLLSSEDKSEICMTVAEEASDEWGDAAGRAWERCLKTAFSQLFCLPAVNEALDSVEMTSEPGQRACVMGREPVSADKSNEMDNAALGEAFPPGRDLNHIVPNGRNV